jgi:hypothetical protein
MNEGLEMMCTEAVVAYSKALSCQEAEKSVKTSVRIVGVPA